MEYIKINSSQNVAIEFRMANLLERIVAFFIDIFIIGTYAYFLLSYVMPALFGAFPLNFYSHFYEPNNRVSLLMVLFSIFFIFPIFFYSFLFELFWNGQTPGKYVMKIKAIKIDGFQMSFLDYLIRWMFRLIDIYLFYGLVAVISIIISKKSQRLGEIASGSATVSLKRDAQIKDTIFTELNTDYVPLFSQVVILSDNDMRIIKENFIVAKKNKDKALLVKLTTKIENVLQIKNPYASEVEFLTVIIKDYNFYTQHN